MGFQIFLVFSLFFSFFSFGSGQDYPLSILFKFDYLKFEFISGIKPAANGTFSVPPQLGIGHESFYTIRQFHDNSLVN